MARAFGEVAEDVMVGPLGSGLLGEFDGGLSIGVCGSLDGGMGGLGEERSNRFANGVVAHRNFRGELDFLPFKVQGNHAAPFVTQIILVEEAHRRMRILEPPALEPIAVVKPLEAL